MATQRMAPDAILEQTNCTGAVAAVQDDPDSPDGSWVTANSNNVNTVLRTSFGTPTYKIRTGANLQEFRVLVKKQGGTGTPTASVQFYNNGSLVSTPVGTTNVTSATGQILAGNFTAPDNIGATVECRVVTTASGGSPGARASVDIGAIEWNADYYKDTTQTSNIGITDTFFKKFTKGPVDSLGITDFLSKSLTKFFSDAVGITSVFVKELGNSWAQAGTGTWSEISGNQWQDPYPFVGGGTENINQVDNVGISDFIVMSKQKNFLESIGITEAFIKTLQKNPVDTVGIESIFQMTKSKGQYNTDEIGITEVFYKKLTKGPVDSEQITDIFSKTIVKTFVDNVGIDDSSSWIKEVLRVEFVDSIGITDTFVTTEDTAPSEPDMSLVDLKREAAITYLVAQTVDTEANLRLLSIEDLAHKYWSHKAGDLNNQALSILDHLQANGYEGWEWLTAIT